MEASSSGGNITTSGLADGPQPPVHLVHLVHLVQVWYIQWKISPVHLVGEGGPQLPMAGDTCMSSHQTAPTPWELLTPAMDVVSSLLAYLDCYKCGCGM